MLAPSPVTTITTPIALRVNHYVDAHTHPYIFTGLKDNKFGIDIDKAPEIYAQALSYSYLKIVGVDCHIGSQITETSTYLDALQKLIRLIHDLEDNGIAILHLDIDGRLGIRCTHETPPTPRMLL